MIRHVLIQQSAELIATLPFSPERISNAQLMPLIEEFSMRKSSSFNHYHTLIV